LAYTPELSLRSSCTLRRISWALNVPMTVGIEYVLLICQRFWTDKRCATNVGIKPDVWIVRSTNDKMR
jgi:hypothetical protein